MVWNNMYLIPIVIIGGLIAFFFGRTIFGGLKRAFSRAMAPRADLVGMPPMAQHQPPQAVRQETMAVESFAPSPPPPDARYANRRPRSLADRREAWEVEAMSVEDEHERLIARITELDAEEERRAKLREEARKRSRSTNILVGKLDVDPTAGPLTKHIAVSEALLAELKAAKAAQEAKSQDAKSPN